MKTIILINQTANHGNAGKKWARLKEEFLCLFPAPVCVIEFNPPFDIGRAVKENVLPDERAHVIFGGGDGTVHYAVNEIMRDEKFRTSFTLGAIGLGSSNDFHKPNKKKIGEVPLRINAANAFRADVGKVTVTRKNGETTERYFVISAGAGIIANGNNHFNKGDLLNRFLKTKSVNLAINYTALKSILLHRNIPVSIRTDKTITRQTRLSNLSLLKTPYLSGNLKYDQEILPDDGFFGLNTCEEMNLPGLVGVFNDLQKGKFSGKPKRFTSKVQHLTLESETEIPIETDGEIQYAVKAEFTLLPSTLTLSS